MENYLKEKFCFHCAPTIMGKKISNLVVLKNRFFLPRELVEYNNLLCELNLNLYLIKITEEYTCVLLYNIDFMEEILKIHEVQMFLQEYGYENFDITKILEILSNRFSLESFPHEIGVFLGYPMEDVKGFIENNGFNYIFSGYWKVYENPENKKELFELYTTCRQKLCNKVNSHSFIDIIKEESNESRNYLLVANR